MVEQLAGERSSCCSYNFIPHYTMYQPIDPAELAGNCSREASERTLRKQAVKRRQQSVLMPLAAWPVPRLPWIAWLVGLHVLDTHIC